MIDCTGGIGTWYLEGVLHEDEIGEIGNDWLLEGVLDTISL